MAIMAFVIHHIMKKANQETVEEYENYIKGMRGEIDSLRNQKDDMRRKIDNLEGNIKSYHATSNSMLKEVDHARLEKIHADEEIADLKQACTLLENDMDHARLEKIHADEERECAVLAIQNAFAALSGFAPPPNISQAEANTALVLLKEETNHQDLHQGIGIGGLGRPLPPMEFH